MWRIVEVVIATEEPIHVEALDYLIQCKRNERIEAVDKLSLLFPIRGSKLHVFHKSGAENNCIGGAWQHSSRINF